MIGSTARIERAPTLNCKYVQSWCALGEQGANMGAGLFVVLCQGFLCLMSPVKG